MYLSQISESLSLRCNLVQILVSFKGHMTSAVYIDQNSLMSYQFGIIYRIIIITYVLMISQQKWPIHACFARPLCHFGQKLADG